MTDAVPPQSLDGRAAAAAEEAAAVSTPVRDDSPENDDLPQGVDIARCIHVLETLVKRPDVLAQVPALQRKELLIIAGKLSRPQRHERERITKAIRRYQRKVDSQEDLELRQTTQIRDARVLPNVPELLEASSTANAPRRARAPGVESLDPASRESSAGRTDEVRRLNRPQHCYVCKCDYTELHHFYDAMCPQCADYNFQKRTQTARLDGRVALVTGARVKIGFFTVLMLLRAGARVIGTSRFPNDAAARFAREPDYESWRDRLALYGLDLRFCPSVEAFAEHVLQNEPQLDLLINNAAQTVHRPNGFFSHLRAVEEQPLEQLPEQVRPLLTRNHQLVQSHQLARGDLAAVHPLVATAGLGVALPTLFGAAAAAGEQDRIHFPPGRFDADGQQLDLRHNNSWRLKAADVSTPELIEVHLVNAIAPFILVSRLKELMCQTPTRDKHIVNVSAMEGVFARQTKTDKHPHTNMAKASLNMLTRTSARDYVRDGIHMNSVDTGWVTDEDPHPHAVRKRRDYDFSPPLDAIDGAARVCDPIFTGYLTGEHPFGHFFKDYRPAVW